VILVEGNERISECIKYLTQSSWSHSALYVGDEPIRRNPEMKAPLVAQFARRRTSWCRGDRRSGVVLCRSANIAISTSAYPPVQPVVGGSAT